MSTPTDVQYPRRIIVDDTDSRVQYIGDWALDIGSFDNLGTFGPPYNHTLHGTKQDGASFLFDFEGEFIQIRGAKDNRKLPPDPELFPLENVTLLAKWSCQVDGGAITRYSYYNDTNYMTHAVLCEQGHLSRQKHTLNLTVIIDDPDTQMFWVDEIEYQPFDGADLQNEVLKIDSSDPSIRYDNSSRGWYTDGGLGIMLNSTGSAGSTMTISFTGTQVALYGFNEGSEHHEKSSARYYIDDSMDTAFQTPESRLAPNGFNTSDYYNQLLFTTPKLKYGSHEMVITFTGVRTGADFPQWLSIDYFYVTSGENAAQLNGTGTGDNSAGDGTGTGGEVANEDSGRSRTPVGPIVGGVVGGVLGLILIVGSILLVLKRRHRRKAEPTSDYYGPGSFNYENSLASPGISSFVPVHPPSTSTPSFTSTPYQPHSPTSNSLTMSGFGVSSPSTPYSPSVGSSTGASTLMPNQNWMDMKTAQRNAVAGMAVERRHQDSGIRYPQGHTVTDIPPNYSVQ
ncbi:hypothetical protein VNI00_010209 [Paramarasmius palmivorus]|uniref:Uncharacterized protein n=1 Tax=Paramarasmius palmivorus TaxID=297713 RepID=A0AAW0CLH8_9AGAR